MMSIEEITALYWETFAAIPGRADRVVFSRIPALEDIAKVEAALSMAFPASVHYFVLHSPYGSPSFTSDFARYPSIVWLNNEFHKNEDGYLPPFFLLWNNGHDGDCIGFDTRVPDANGEYPLLYWDCESMTEADIPAAPLVAPSFPAWLLKETEHLLSYVR